MRNKLSEYLPEFPKTFHLPYQPKDDGDRVATTKEIDKLLSNKFVVEEKVDGANTGICLLEGNPIVRGRTKFIRKSNLKSTTSNKQFARIWNWIYDNIDKFNKLNELGSYSVYGEWLLAQHGMKYEQLPSYFIAFDVYDYEERVYIPSNKTREILDQCEFDIVPKLKCESFDYETLKALTEEKSLFSNSPREGVYIKFYDKEQVLARYKLIREDFKQGKLWNNDLLIKNELK